MPRVLLIGVDGLSPDLVREWAEAGYLPHLREMLAEGVGGPLRSTPEFSSPQAWPSLMTGTNPAKHGIFSFLQRVPGSYDVAHVTSNDIQVATIFAMLSKAGARVACLNMPCTYPMGPLNGLGVAGWLCPSLRHRGATWPPKLADELRRRFGSYPFHAEVKRHVLRGRYQLAIEAALAGLRKKSEIGKYLYRQGSWDLFAIAFVETDAIQHYFWHLCDPGHPDYDAELVNRWGNPVLQAYQLIDDVIGQWQELVGDDTVIIIASDHGAGIYNRGRTYLPNLLREVGLTVDRPAAFRQLRAIGGAGRQKLGEVLHHLLPKRLKMRLYNTRFGRRAVESFFSRQLTDAIDWQRTRAYCYYWETAPWVNVRGREPEGIVAAGKEYEDMRAQLIDLISLAEDAATGQPAADRVYLREELYNGPYLEVIPDVGIWWNQQITLEGPLVANFGGRRVEVKPAIAVPGITGGHAPEGTLVMWGPSVGSGAPVTGARIEDITATILRLLGQPVPHDMDGVPLECCFESNFAKAERAAAAQGANTVPPASPYTAEEEEIIIERLRNLGYM